MKSIVEQKSAIDQEITLLNSKVDTTNEQIAAYSQLIADTQEELDEAQEDLRKLSEEHRERVRAIVPSSLITSISTPTGCTPARRQRSTAASVWPARLSTPASWA